MSNKESISLIVTEIILHLSVTRMSNEQFIFLVTELNLNVNDKRMSKEEFILLIVAELNLSL